jgi:hypothetical protein
MLAIQEIPIDELPRLGDENDAIDRISDVLEVAGIDAPTALFDEALQLARAGNLVQSRNRLRMLLCLDPEDGAAHLLLAKVLAGQGRWIDTIGAFDAARACGMHVPPDLQEKVETNLAMERNGSDAQANRIATREQAELRTLRAETRKLRTENLHLERSARVSTDRSRHWSIIAALTSCIATLLLAVQLFGGNGNDSEEIIIEPADSSLALDTVIPEIQIETVEAPVAMVAAPEELPAANPEPNVAPLVNNTAIHTVKGGDTLYKLAGRYYGNPTLWTRIRDENRAKLGSGIQLKLGMELTIP